MSPYGGHWKPKNWRTANAGRNDSHGFIHIPQWSIQDSHGIVDSLKVTFKGKLASILLKGKQATTVLEVIGVSPHLRR